MAGVTVTVGGFHDHLDDADFYFVLQRLDPEMARLLYQDPSK
jgi:hypothetical protein